MANSQLLNKQYKIPSDVLKYIQTVLVSNPQGNGIRRAKFYLKNGSITYQVLERLKHFFDHFNLKTDDKTQYALAGGDLMKNFVNQTLQNDRNAVKRGVDTKRDLTQKISQDTRPYDPSRNIQEAKEKKKENALAIILNHDNKFLLLKRTEVKNGWGNNQYGLVGGQIEKNETPEEACKREVKEETGLEINNFTKKFTINRNPNSIEYIFTCEYDGDPTEIELNNEHTNYGWFDLGEIEFLDTVPNLNEYLILAFTKYN